MISSKDRLHLRELAKYQLEHANAPGNLERKKEWYRHHRFKKGRPMIHIEWWTFANDLLPKRLQCEGELARTIETQLYKNFLNQTVFMDDVVIPDHFPVQWKTSFELFDLPAHIIHPSEASTDSVGHQFTHQINDFANDVPQLRPSTYSVDKEGTLFYRQLVEDTFGDILPTKMSMDCLYSVPTQKLVHLMGMESMFFAMYDYPDLFKALMDRIADDYVSYFKWLETEKLLLPTYEGESLGNGSFCFDESLKRTDDSLTTKDVWGFMDSQETVGISKDMFKEFIFPCYEKVASLFGKLSYGCCEPVDSIWESSLSKLSNLSKISISPWCNEKAMGDYLADKPIIYFRKPSPNFLGVTPDLDEQAFRSHIRETFSHTKNCQLEFAQRDVYTIHHNEAKVRRAVEIIREEAERSSL